MSARSRNRWGGVLAPAAALAIATVGGATAEPVALTGATVHTVAQGTLENATVVFDGERIVSVAAAAAAPAGARVIDCRGKHVWPGFIHSNTTLGLTEVSSVRGTNDFAEMGRVNPNIRAEVALNPESDLIPVARAGGITSALIVPRGAAITGTSALIRLDGWTYEDMTRRTPVALHVIWPAMGISRSFFETRSEEEQKKERDRAIQDVRQAFEDARAYGTARGAAGKPGVPRHDQDVKWDAMLKALRGEIPVLFHCTALNQMQAILKFVDEQELRNVGLVGGYDAWRVADELKRRNIAVITGGTLELPARGSDTYDASMSLPARLQAAGVRFCIADGGETGNARNLSQHAAMAAAFGLTRDQALRAVTLSAAEILGVGDRLGSIETGKLADLVVGDGDPLEMTTHIEQVWIAGKPTSMENRQTRLFQKYDQRPRGPQARPR